MQSELLTFARCALVTTIVGLVACSDAGVDGSLSFDQAAIVNGEISDESDDHVVEVHGRVSEEYTLRCTGTLVAPDIVLTALHCVSHRNDPLSAFTCSRDGTLSSPTPGAGTLGAPIAGPDVQVFLGATPGSEPAARGIRVFGTGSMQICRGDVAAVVLDQPISENYAPVRFGRGVSLGESMRVVGYGQSEEPTEMGRRFRTGRRVLEVGPVGSEPGSGTAAPNTFILGEGACYGDSGGPALSEETGAVTGVYSLSAAASCTASGVRNTYTLVSSFESFIRQAFTFADREPWIEEGAGATGGTSSTGGSGGSGASGEGSGSREDPSCACRAGRPQSAAYAGYALVLATFAFARRRRTKRGSGSR